MSEENIELYSMGNEAFNRRDVDALLTVVDPDVVLISRIADMEGGGPYRGHDGVRRWLATIFEMAPDFSAEVEEIRDLGDLTLARVRNRGRGLESSAPMDQTSWQVGEWRHKKLVWLAIFLSEAEALEAIETR